MTDSDLNDLKHRLRANPGLMWAQARDWDLFHSPKNLLIEFNVGAASAANSQWLTEEQ